MKQNKSKKKAPTNKGSGSQEQDKYEGYTMPPAEAERINDDIKDNSDPKEKDKANEKDHRTSRHDENPESIDNDTKFEK